MSNSGVGEREHRDDQKRDERMELVLEPVQRRSLFNDQILELLEMLLTQFLLSACES